MGEQKTLEVNQRKQGYILIQGLIISSKNNIFNLFVYNFGVEVISTETRLKTIYYLINLIIITFIICIKCQGF